MAPNGTTAALPSKPLDTVREHQANERTMLAWIRTGIALMGFGFAIARFGLFLRELVPSGTVAPKAVQSLGSGWVGTLLVALGMMTNLAAVLRYARVRHAIERGDLGAPSSALVYALGTGAALIGLLMTVLLLRGLAV